MHDLPVMLRVRGRKVVIVGGGVVARRRAASLLEAGADVTVIAPHIAPDLAAMNVTCIERGYQPGDLRGAFLVLTATDNPEVNRQVGEEAQREAILINRTDEPDLGDLTIPAHTRVGPVTVAVGSGGISPKASAMMRDQMIVELDRDWLVLLETIEPLRRTIHDSIPDITRRRIAMHKLTDPETMALLKEKGPEGVRRYAQQVILDLQQAANPVVADNEDG